MAIGSKYTPLTQWLQECGEDSVRLTFDELNTIITIPNYAYKDMPGIEKAPRAHACCSFFPNRTRFV